VPSWSLTFESERERAEELAADLFQAGAGGVELRDGEVAPMPGARQPPPGRALLVAWFSDRAAAEEAARMLGGGQIESVEEADWGEVWKRGLEPLVVGRVFVRPSWVDAAPPPGTAEVVLDPGMAFGTGTHPTTALCLAALSDLLAARPGTSVLDVGTGSGLLAIAAAKLGAGRVAANDEDPVAVRVARENAAANGAAVEIGQEPVARIVGTFDLVVANILANTLVELAGEISAKVAPGGTVLLSGILAPQEDEVCAAYVARGLVPAPGRREGGWALVALRRP
jgi:ribosomal protein L11 methyltransferase